MNFFESFLDELEKIGLLRAPRAPVRPAAPPPGTRTGTMGGQRVQYPTGAHPPTPTAAQAKGAGGRTLIWRRAPATLQKPGTPELGTWMPRPLTPGQVLG